MTAESVWRTKREAIEPRAMLDLTDEEDSTQVEVPTLGGDEDESGSYKLHDDGPKKNVVLFADEDESPAPAAKSKRGRPDDSFALAESGVEFSEAEDFADDEDLEVADDVLSEEGELDEIDVFEPAEEDFDSSVQSGESHAEIAAPVATLRSAAPVEAEWDGLTFAGFGNLGNLSGLGRRDDVRPGPDRMVLRPERHRRERLARLGRRPVQELKS